MRKPKGGKGSAPAQTEEPSSGPGCFINRELSWVDFNERVLMQAMDPSWPLLERAKFLSIFYNNLDEFFMIRVSGLVRQLNEGFLELPPDRMTPSQQLGALRERVTALLDRADRCFRNHLLPELEKAGISFVQPESVKDKQRGYMKRFFDREIFPILTPLAFDAGHPFPHISNLSLNLAVILKDQKRGERFARLKVPDTFPRLMPIPLDEDKPLKRMGLFDGGKRFMWFEELIRMNLDSLFPGYRVEDSYLFRVTRDADIEIEEDEADDLLESIQEGVDRREFGSVVRLEIEERAPKRIRNMLAENLNILPHQVYPLTPPLGLSCLMELWRLKRQDLKDRPFQPFIPKDMSPGRDLFRTVRSRDVMLFHPYDSFSPLVDFIRQSANDPSVLAIKQTLYRVGANSPVVEALLEARQQDKQVSVLVELKARFDEENNIGWAKRLEAEGVHVVYGVPGLKTHAKICLVVRREKGGIVRYVHLGTGNYNAATASVYSDLGLLTCDPDIGADASEFFNALTGYSKQDSYRKIITAPSAMRRKLLELIDREVRNHLAGLGGAIIMKMNALVDRRCIEALYRASRSGVPVFLIVRGMCCLKPKVKDLSDRIEVVSIVGRFLEHARVFAFYNGGDPRVYLGSADLMPRNLDRRVELLFPLEDRRLKDAVMRFVLIPQMLDRRRAFYLNPDGTYSPPSAEGFDSQGWLIENRGLWHPKEFR
ncbi:MAG: polyphosphate kinase 1 [Thermanaerothrix sp.]|nr:polyphosphate kinase 1 [Thermanaerothrix sp.]